MGVLPDLPLGSVDPDILLWAEKAGRILVSEDKNTLPGHLADHVRAGHHSPGIFLVPLTCTIPRVVSFLVAAAYASDPGEWQDRIEYLS